MNIRNALLLIPVLILTGCSSGQNKEVLMSAAGFRTIVPSTPAQVSQLQTIPQGKIIPISKKGKTFFLYADARNKTLLIGNQQQFTTYQQYVRQYKLQEDKVEAADMNADYWGGWGGGFWGPGFY
jgi:hypothetical protein